MTDEHEAPQPEPPFVPSDLRLRTERPRVTRLSRKVLIGLGGVGCLVVAGALFFALQPRDSGTGSEELYSTGNRTTADGLSGLPKDYSGIPKLGPPLPGDLGRPILSAQNAGLPVPVLGPTPAPGVNTDEQRRAQEVEAARVSRLFSGGEVRSAAPATAAAVPASTGSSPSPTPDLASLGLAPQSSTPTAQQKQTAFLNSPVDRRTVSPDQLEGPASPYVLQAGAIIPAALITGIRSDLPGQITAQVTEDVYDSPTGRYLLIPQGTRLIGQYDSDVEFGQQRVLLVWNRLILPNGKSIVLERLPSADAGGYAGLEDGVDYHWWDLAKAAGLSTLLGVGAQLATNNTDPLVQAIREGTQNTVSDAGQQIVRRQLSVQPTLTVRPGFPVRVIVTHDLVLEPYGG